MTLVLANPERRYPLACREDPERLGVRLIDGPLAGASCPIFQTSANPSGEPAPARFDDVDPAIVDAVDLAIDGGELTGQPSTVVDLTALEAGGGVEDPARGRGERGELEARLGVAGSSVASAASSLAPRRRTELPVARLDRVRIAIGSDHAGFELKEAVAPLAAGGGHELVDVGTDSPESVDYPDSRPRAAQLVGDGEADRAVIVCGSGVGVSIVANKVDGVRAVNAHDAEEAEMSRRHNDANVLTLAGRRLGAERAGPIVETFLATDFEGGRHARRVDKIAARRSAARQLQTQQRG